MHRSSRVSELTALQSALAAEQAIVYGYGVVGAHLSGKAETYAGDRLVAHEQMRDTLADLIREQSAVPATALPAYQLPFPVSDALSARRLAGALENGAAGAAWDLTDAASASSQARGLAVDWMADVAVAAALWGAAQALPGLPAS